MIYGGTFLAGPAEPPRRSASGIVVSLGDRAIALELA